MTTTEIGAAWKRYRIRMWTTLAWVGLAVAARFPPLSQFHVEIWFIIGIVANVFWFLTFKCPQCGKPFFRKGGWQNLLARRCLNCGLQKYQGPPPAAS